MNRSDWGSGASASRKIFVIAVLLMAVFGFGSQMAWGREPSGIPERDYTLWGRAYVDGVALTHNDSGYTVSLLVDGVGLASYVMGSRPVNGDWYVLRVPMSAGERVGCAQPGDTAYIYINGVLIAEAYLEPVHQSIAFPITIGNPGETVRMSVYAQIPPGAIVDLSAATGTNCGEVALLWTAAGNNGALGAALSYVVKYSPNPITNQTEFDNATTFPQSWTPEPPGESENHTVTGLASGQTYYFAVEAVDGVPLQASMSNNPVSAMAKPSIPPVASDLAITPPDPETGDDLVGSYTYYDEEGHPESGSTEIRWYKNAELQTNYNDILTIPTSVTAKEQQWHFTVKPHDGYVYGDLQTSDPVTVGNTPPEASDVFISPSLPITGDDLTANYTYSDADGDSESGTTIRWYKGGNIQSAYNDLTTVPSSATAKGEEWRFTVRPGDGTELGTYKTASTVTIGNTPPMASNLLISPVSPLTGDDLTGSYTYSDADGDPEDGAEIRWYMNDTLQSAYNDTLTVPSSATLEGQQWHFTVRPFDRFVFGDLQTSDAVTIDNTPPAANNAIITPEIPWPNDDLVGSYSYSDADGDPEGESEIRWYMDDVVQTGYNDVLTIPSSVTVKGQHWYFTVRPYDGLSFGVLQTSNAVMITSFKPVASDLSITPVSPLTGDDLVGSYTYSDADGDPEDGTEIRWYMNGDLQAGYNDTLTVPFNATSREEQWYFTVRPSDGISFGDLQTSDPVTIGNTPPLSSDHESIPASPITGDDLTANYTYSDAENDPEDGTEIRWYMNGDLQAGYNDQKILPSSATTRGQEWYFAMRPKDGTNFGLEGASLPVVIGNTRAEASDVFISPDLPFTTDDLTANYTYSDADGDPESGTTIRWYKNGNIQAMYNNTTTVPSSATSKDEWWRFTVRPGDGTELGPYKTATSVLIANSSPVADAGGTYEAFSGEEVVFDGSGSYDADGDSPLTYLWDFGDNTTGVGVNPTHVYAQGAYTVVLTVNDGTEDSVPSVAAVYIDTDPDTVEQAVFELGVGWNLISINLQPENTSIEQVLSSIAGKYDAVWAYAAATGEWRKHDNSSPPFLNDLNDIEPGEGYWIDMTDSGMLMIQGTLPETAVTLEPGWNLVGYSSQSPKLVADCVISIQGKFNSICTYDAHEGKWFRYIPDGPPLLNDLEFMWSGKGYWIDAKERCEWDVGP